MIECWKKWPALIHGWRTFNIIYQTVPHVRRLSQSLDISLTKTIIYSVWRYTVPWADQNTHGFKIVNIWDCFTNINVSELASCNICVIKSIQCPDDSFKPPNLHLLCIQQSDINPFCENYAKLCFDAKHLDKGLDREWWHFLCLFFFPKRALLPTLDAALIF